MSADAPQGRGPDSLWRRLARDRRALAGGVIVALAVATALFAPLLAPHPYAQTSLINVWAPPDADNWLGTDTVSYTHLTLPTNREV